jgi:hypothetical protein
MADVASKQQTTALFLSTTLTRTRRCTEPTKKLTNLMGNLCCAKEHTVQIFLQFFLHSETAQFNLGCMEPLNIVKVIFILETYRSPIGSVSRDATSSTKHRLCTADSSQNTTNHQLRTIKRQTTSGKLALNLRTTQ